MDDGITVASLPGVTVFLALDPGPGTVIGAQSMLTSNGVATFTNVAVATLGTFTFDAFSPNSSPALTPGTSNSFTITAGTGQLLLFSTNPAATTALGSTFSCSVRAYDPTGTVLATGFGGTVALSLTSLSGIPTFSGTTSILAAGGIANFAGLGINKVGTYTLTATSGSLTSAVSSSFQITLAAPNQMVITAPSSTSVGALISISVTLYCSNLNPISGVYTISLAIKTGAGTLVGTTSMSTTASGTAAFSGLAFDTATSYVLTATCSDCGPAFSQDLSSITVAGAGGSKVTVTLASTFAYVSSTFSYQLALQHVPLASVTITVASAAPGITIPTSTFTFTTGNYNVVQTVSVNIGAGAVTGSTLSTTAIIHQTTTGSSDTSYNGNEQYIGCGNVALNGDLTINVVNQLTIPEVLLTTSDSVTVVGETASYSVVLSVAPAANVVVTPSASVTGTTFTPTSLTFTPGNYNVAQFISVLVPALSSALGYVLCGVTHSLTSTDPVYANYEVIPQVFQVTEFTTSTVSGILQSAYPVFNEPSGSYTVKLLSQPTSPVTITLSVTPSIMTVSPTVLVFTSANYGTTQTVTITTLATAVSHGKVYSALIAHSVQSQDPNYSSSVYFSLQQSLPVYVMNTCTSGQYTNLPGSGTCVACPAGYYCPQPYGNKVACASGYYSAANALICLPCAAGSQCSNASSPAACAIGTYSTGSAVVCTPCPAGYSCPSQSTIVPCPIGTYSALSAGSCTECPAGQYCSDPTNPPQTCASGYASAKGAVRCSKCPPGFQCPTSNWGNVTPCAVGTYSPGGVATCVTCPAAHRCSLFDDLGICPEGTYSIAGSGNCLICPAGFSCQSGVKSACSAYSLNGDGNCRTCPAGSSCVSGVAPIECPAGSVSVGGNTTTCTACTLGQYVTAGVCTPCPIGMYCPSPNNVPLLCPFGTYSAGTGASACTVCNAGVLCIYGSITASPANSACPMGFYCESVTFAGIVAIMPIPCPIYKQNPALGKSLSTDCTDCAAGYECWEGTAYQEVRLCPPGYYCGPGVAPQSCSATTYNPRFGMTTSAACISVPAGYYSNTGSPYLLKCPTGKYCTGGTAPTSCPAGTFNPTILAVDTSSCLPCPAGYTCPGTGNSFPTPCGVGSFNSAPSSTAATCASSSASFAAPFMTMTQDAVIPCAAGHYCTSSTNFPEDNPCAAGKYYDGVDLAASAGCLQCPAGYACLAGTCSSRQPPINCAQGHYCPAGSSSATGNPCPVGTYTNKVYLTVATDCSNCPAGFACIAGSVSPVPCHAGYYCPPKTTNNNDNPCPDGTFSTSNNLADASECTACPKGYYCQTHCTKPLPCNAGTYNPSYNGISSAAACLPCPAGSYCPQAAIAPEPCGQGFYSGPGVTSLAGCIICEAGTYCPVAANSDTQKALNICPAGLYCPAQTDHIPTNLLDRCPAGSYCTAGTTTPTACSPGSMRTLPGGAVSGDCEAVYGGYFGSSNGQSAPTGVCSAGYWCGAGSTSATQNACLPGTFRSLPGASQSSDCAPCPAGYYCGSHTVTPTPCTTGHYCPVGTSGPTDLVYSPPVACPTGTFNPDTGSTVSADCLPCLPGQYCATTGLSAPTGSCAAGYYCTSGATTDQPTIPAQGGICPAGGYCGVGTVNPQNCPIGTYNPTTGAQTNAACISCPVGYYCAGINPIDPTQPTGPCIAGFYCTGGASTQTQNTAAAGYYSGAAASGQLPCLAGTYNPRQAQSACLSCPQGFYCPTGHMTTPTICPIGQFCPASSTSPQDCPQGTYMPNTGTMASINCYPCDMGKACTGTGLTTSGVTCSAGYWCRSSAISITPGESPNQYGQCTTGTYCPSGTTYPISCAPGTFNPASGSTVSGACGTCTAGSYCETYGLPGVSGACQIGFFCPAGSKQKMATANICPTGSFCLGGVSASTQCSAGKYQQSQGQSTCTICPAGFYCLLGTSNFISTNCPAGYWCPAQTTTSTANSCSTGTYNPNLGSMAAASCIPCDPGSYCGTSGLSAPSALCDPGWYCTASAVQARPAIPAQGGECGIGYYCPSGSNVPLACNGGKYCATVGLGAPTANCNAGYYCVYNSQVANPVDGTTGNQCTAGHYCVAGSVSQVPCAAGSYSTATAAISSATCVTCDAGKYCESAGATSFSGQCSAGWFCIAGSLQSKPKTGGCPAGSECAAGVSVATVCSAGTYQSMTLQSSCITCPAGYYCDGTSPTTPIECPAGSYCPAGTHSGTDNQCQLGTYNPLTGMMTSAACLNCPPGKYCGTTGLSTPSGPCSAGYYCISAAQTATPNTPGQGLICPIGSICVLGSSAPQLCPPGSYCDTTGRSTAAGLCSAGFICVLGATSPNPAVTTATGGPCPAGFYCAAGSQYAVPCPLGKFNPSTQSISNAACVSCTAGFYCDHPGSSAVAGPCAPGYYCPTGQYTNKPSSFICTVGNYCAGSTGSGLPGNVLPVSCASGTYNQIIGQTSCFACPAGFRCEGSTTLPIQCDQGYYCPGGNSLATQIQCPAGQYNAYTGRSACIPCPIGFYCPLGCITPIICTAAAYCPAGSGAPIICSQGFWTNLVGLQTAAQCMPCSAGQYCLNGVQVGNCQAGYYCSAANYVNNPNLGLVGAAIGYLCPVGHYCLVGSTLPTPCPYGKFTSGSGAATLNQCQNCAAGYYCIPGDPNPYVCPIGAYCPAASQTPTNCPSLTYSLTTMASTADTCQPCPAGYLCTDVGIGDYHSRPCSPGYYCPSQATTLIPCSEGTWSIVSNAAGCSSCPPGFQCGSNADTEVPCPRGNWCAGGTGLVAPYCSPGVYCEYAAAYQFICPGGYYCPALNSTFTESPPLRCPLGYYCPAGSSFPTKCPNGSVYTQYSLRLNPSEACATCGPGLYSSGDVLHCNNCYAGYACPNGASRPDPQSLTADGGYPCPAGFYCPEGTGDPLPCPAGTFNQLTQGMNITWCVPCAVDTYSDLEGQAGCYPCGANAFSIEGQPTCTCYGSYRTYMKRDGTCRCKPGYVFYQSGTTISDIDSRDPCVSNVLPLCASGSIRAPDGSCKTESDCSAECNGGVGTRKPGLGVCLCKDIPSLDDICNAQCRATAPSVQLNTDGTFSLRDPTKPYVDTLDFQSTPGYLGHISCFSGLSCSVTTTNMTDTGLFLSNYKPTVFQNYANSLLPNVSRRRILQANSGSSLQNPVYCLNLGQTMVFSITSQRHYPVYLKNSILNTNKNFDFSPFLELANFIANGGTPISNFAYTFIDSGKYVFADAADNSNMILVSVMASGATCSQETVRERSESTMTRIGIVVDPSFDTATQWIEFVFLLGTALLLLVTVIGIFVFRRRRIVPKVGKSGKVGPSTGLIQRQVEDVLTAEIGAQNRLTEVDPAFFQVIYDKLIDNFHILAARLTDRSAEEQARLEAMLEALKKVREAATDTKRPYAQTLTAQRSVTLLGEKGFQPADNDPDKQEMVERIKHDSRLDEQEKQGLLKELEEEMNRLEAQLAENRVAGENNLKRRLEEKAKRKKDLMRRRQELAAEEDQIQADLQKQAKDAEVLNREADRDFEKERRKARETAIGPEAKALRKVLEDRIRDNPAREDELIADFDRQMDRLESRLDAEKRRQLEDALRRAEEKRSARKKKSSDRAKVASDLQAQSDRVKAEIAQIDEQLDLMEKMNEPTEKPETEMHVDELSPQEEESVRKQYLMRQRDMDKEYQGKMDELNRQKQRLTQALAQPDFDQDKRKLQADLERVEETLERLKKEQIEKQKQLLEARLLDRKRKRDLKTRERQTEDDQRRGLQDRESDQKLIQLKDILNMLPVSEKVEAARKLLAEKHDAEIVDIQRQQQEQAAKEYRLHIKRVMDAKVAATKAVPEHLSSLSEAEQKANFSQLMMGVQTELQEDLQNRMKELQTQGIREMEELAVRQARELRDLLKSLEPEVPKEDLYRLEADFDRRRGELEDENAHRFEALQKQNEELVATLQQKRQQLTEAVLQAQQLQEIERAKRVLEDKHRKEFEALERTQNLTNQQIEIILARHKQEVDQLEQSLQEEQNRHKEQLAARLQVKRGRKQKLLDLPEDLKSLAPTNATLISNWRKSQHQSLLEVSDDPMFELLRRVERIERIVQNVEEVQFDQLQKAFASVLELQKKQ